MAAAGVTLFRTAGFTAALALALLTAAHRFRVAAIIRARPSGLRRRSFLSAFAGAGVVASSALAFLAAVHRFLSAAATRLRAAAPGAGAGGEPPRCSRRCALRPWISG